MTLRIGSRGSQLALWQAEFIAGRLRAECGADTRIEIIKTTGDRLQTADAGLPLDKGLFTKEIEEALLTGAVDVAVHSLKDLPINGASGLAIAAIPKREDPRDALVGLKLDEIKPGSRIGTSSDRRAAQLRMLKKGIHIQSIRGNVDTRLRKLKAGEFDSVVLAAAGLRRLGLAEEIAEILSPHQVCPAPGQGALAVQTRAGDEAFEVCKRLDDAAARLEVECERLILGALGGGCRVPIGAFATAREGAFRVQAIVLMPDGSDSVKGSKEGGMADARSLALELARELQLGGAAQMLRNEIAWPR
jgi:hydroxymethylbilane synthase